MCEIYSEKTNIISPPPPPILKRDQKKWLLGELKEFVPEMFAWGAYCVCCQKKNTKIKYGFEDPISNVDLSSAAN